MRQTNQQPAVVVAVGTDHHPFDRLVQWIDAWAAEHPAVEVLIQRGTSRPTVHCPSVELIPYAELCEAFARASVVVSHGGPSTVMDARAAGRLPVVVARNPRFHEHVDDHQMRFAAHLERHELARVVDEQSLLNASLDEALVHPHRFTVPVDGSTITGVLEFGRVLDRLLRTETPVVPSSVAGVEEAVDDRAVVGSELDPIGRPPRVEAAAGAAALERNRA